MKTNASPAIIRRLGVLLPLAAAAFALSSCTTGPMDHVAFGSGYHPGHGHGHGGGSWAGRGDGGHDRGAGWDRGHEGDYGDRGRGRGHGEDYEEHPGRGRRPGGEGSPGGSGGIWTGPAPWPDGVARPDAGGGSVFRDPGIRLGDPALAGRLRPVPGSAPAFRDPGVRLTDPAPAGRLRPEPRVTVDSSRLRGDVRLTNPEALRTALRPEPRPAETARMVPDVRLSGAAAERIRLAAPGALARPAAPLRVDSAVLRNPALRSVGSLRP